jgi:flagellar biosynthetic protein FlhB
MAEQDIDRSEEATPFKLQKAREQGQTARSADAVACAVFLVAVLYLAAQGMQTITVVLQLARAALVQASPAGGDVAALWPRVAQLAGAAGGALLLLLLSLPLAAVVASVAQTGMVFSFKPLHMDFQRLNPATGFQRVFSRRTLFDGGRACVKLVLLSGAAALALWALLPQFPALSALSPAAFLRTLVDDLAILGWKMGAALAVIAAADILFTRREFGRRMRMSRRELKDEYKNREGDPRIRARLRELRRELLKRSQSLKNTRHADVVVTNPTHYAVALRYVHGEMDAPCLVAKGAGPLAAAMREIAGRHHVIVVQNPPLARRLFREAAIDAYLPASFHAEVARLIVWVLAVRRERERLAAAACNAGVGP